jgi:hypothetical protein
MQRLSAISILLVVEIFVGVDTRVRCIAKLAGLFVRNYASRALVISGNDGVAIKFDVEGAGPLRND